jgi:hypothetical protein
VQACNRVAEWWNYLSENLPALAIAIVVILAFVYLLQGLVER